MHPARKKNFCHIHCLRLPGLPKPGRCSMLLLLQLLQSFSLFRLLSEKHCRTWHSRPESCIFRQSAEPGAAALCFLRNTVVSQSAVFCPCHPHPACLLSEPPATGSMVSIIRSVSRQPPGPMESTFRSAGSRRVHGIHLQASRQPPGPWYPPSGQPTTAGSVGS